MSLSVQTRITDELAGYLGTIAAVQYNLQLCPGSNLLKKLIVGNIVDNKEIESCIMAV